MKFEGHITAYIYQHGSDDREYGIATILAYIFPYSRFIWHDEHPRRWHRRGPTVDKGYKLRVSLASATRVLVVADETAIIKMDKNKPHLWKEKTMSNISFLYFYQLSNTRHTY